MPCSFADTIETLKKMEKQATSWEKISTKHTFDKSLVNIKYKNLQLNNMDRHHKFFNEQHI